ncbi:hypothetical protein L798_06127 [Zootermopsis nevadensis]|uniref:Uncharacterized protein n=1 Tax=Zootermopsis nevadensis TaxID=136037 RepID=A0A067RA52_ZOONE|nr:hypothetical protein L798_06127 [Zootermopsis nevadensis]
MGICFICFFSRRAPVHASDFLRNLGIIVDACSRTYTTQITLPVRQRTDTGPRWWTVL